MSRRELAARCGIRTWRARSRQGPPCGGRFVDAEQHPEHGVPQVNADWLAQDASSMAAPVFSREPVFVHNISGHGYSPRMSGILEQQAVLHFLVPRPGSQAAPHAGKCPAAARGKHAVPENRHQRLTLISDCCVRARGWASTTAICIWSLRTGTGST